MECLKEQKWENDESSILKIIDEIRDGYLASNETIKITDYGSGNPTSRRSNQQMHEGVIKKETVSEVCKRASTKNKWGQLIFKLIRDFKPENCLELGTCLGISGAYQVSALKLNGKGQFITVEGSPEIAKIADNGLKKLNYQGYKVNVGRFFDVLPKILSKNNLIDFVFIDGHHDKIATKKYYEFIYPYLNERSIVIFDDINWSDGMKEVWKIIHEEGEGIKTSFDFYKWGICFIDKNKKESERSFYKIGY